MWRGIKASLILSPIALIASAVSAQIQQGTSPQIGDESTAPIGGELLTEFRFRGVPGIVLEGDVSANWGSLETVVLPTGTPLAIIREKRTKACQSRTNIGWLNCVIDTDSDGRFDRVSFNDVAGAKDIIPPVPYHRGPVSMGVDPRFGEGDNFKRVYVFTGVSGSTLTVSYREFVNDLARPAFTEALSIPLGANFPQRVSLKSHVFEILGVDGLGVHYRVIQ